MRTANVRVDRLPAKLVSDDTRVIPRYLDFTSPRRIRSIVRRIMRLTDQQVREELDEVFEHFGHRHRDLQACLLGNYGRAARSVVTEKPSCQSRQLLIGAYFTAEYSIESAALFNPSIIPSPNQVGVPAGSLRFLLSLRAVGEGHISSIVFRRGMIDAAGRLIFDPPPRYAYSTQPVAGRRLDKQTFLTRLSELRTPTEVTRRATEHLPDPFTLTDLQESVDRMRRSSPTASLTRSIVADMLWLAQANYELTFPDDCRPSEIVIFPATDYERQGMEDLRLVAFTDDDGSTHYYGTYTAFGGARILPMLLETHDFSTFRVRTMTGRHVRNKGMALFPRRIDGRYAMVSRHDGECLFLLQSDSLYVWNDAHKLQAPCEPWELTQLGNCGSPIETDAGWLLLTHGVGPMRRYCIGAMLLDRDNPRRILARLRAPLIAPIHEEREGYVPNVVYSCGSIVHNDHLVIPYAMADEATSFARVSLPGLLAELGRSPA